MMPYGSTAVSYTRPSSSSRHHNNDLPCSPLLPLGNSNLLQRRHSFENALLPNHPILRLPIRPPFQPPISHLHAPSAIPQTTKA